MSRVAEKVAQEREDLGRVNPVLAQAVEARMLGRPFLEDPFGSVSSSTKGLFLAMSTPLEGALIR
ncbi:MAG: hypothetical protein M0005_17435 [Actinomycetota bacterium]|nr:hypothetical protein [Actinomycetota bacterium]